MSKSRGRTRYLTPEEETRLLAALPEGVKRDAAMFLLDTGARVNEVLKLTWQDLAVHPDLSAVTFWRTKSKRARTVPLTARAADCLRRAKEAGRSRPFPILYSAFWDGYTAAKRKAGFDGDGGEPIVVHTLRHTCASRLVQRGASLYLVQNWLGHSSPAQTARYSHLNPESLRPLVQLLERPA
jgi:integrase